MTKIDLCNSALARCGAEPISTLTDDTKRAKVVSAQYEITLKELLTDSPWNFAIGRVELSDSGAEIPFGFSYKYELPEDCIRVLELENKSPYRVEEGYILCDVAEAIKIKYIKFADDPSKYSGAFVKALTLKLAEDISYILVQSAALQQQISSEAERYLRKARSMNSQEGTPESRYNEEYVYGVRV